jgi:predicted phage-related endonuclease
LITHSLVQGSAEWHAYRAAHFNASDAPAMMGVSAYKTRSELVREYATGVSKEVDAFTQARFDDGHHFEALARPLAEQIIGEDLYPVVGSEGKYSASFDGLTMSESIGFEHKSLNDDLRAVMVDGCDGHDLPMMYQVQMEQQCMVSGAGRILFMASKWENDELVEERHCWYEANEALRADIVAGWAQFEIDVAAYQPVEVLPAAVAAAVQDLPALSIRVDGQLTLNHNLVLFGERLQSFIADIDTNPSDDQAFADAEQAIKVMERAETALGAAEASALGQISTVDEMVRTVASYRELARKTRLMLEKVVKARKETIRVEIQQGAKDKAAAHIAALNARLGKPYMPAVAVDFAGVMKGKKTVTSLRDAVDTELARFKIEANAIADRIGFNLAMLRELASDYTFLFADTASIVLKGADDLMALIKLRIAEHEQAEAAKAEALRARIAEEERVKAEKAAADAERARQQQEAARIQAEAEARAREEAAARAQQEAAAKLEADHAEALEINAAGHYYHATLKRDDGKPIMCNPNGSRSVFCDIDEDHGTLLPAQVTPIAAARPAAVPTTAPTLRLGQICERLGFTMTADFLAKLGFVHAAQEKAAKLYHESDFPSICAALIRHIADIQQEKAA